MEAFKGKALREAVTIYEHLLLTGRTVDWLIEHNKESLHTRLGDDSSQPAQTKRSRESNPTPRPSRQKKIVPLLKPGETEEMPGVKCDKCSGIIYIEGICGGNPIVREGFTRRGLCGECGNEFNIR